MKNRFFFEGSLQISSLALEDSEFHHLAHVLRLEVGDPIEIVNGEGELATASITALEKSAAIVQITHVQTESSKGPEIILAQAFIRSLEWVVEKGTELGATEFWLYPGALGDKKQAKEHRLKTITISALKQCGRLFLPKIVMKPSLETWKKPSGALFFGDLSPDAPKLSQITDSAIMVIGPEKGFAASEVHHLKAIGGQGIKLHNNVLRAETAGITALSQLYLIV
jgi:16S rRNA (uracil1498-N3)-methyltransferase